MTLLRRMLAFGQGTTVLVHALMALNVYRMTVPYVYYRLGDKTSFLLLMAFWLLLLVAGPAMARKMGPVWSERTGRVLVTVLAALPLLNAVETTGHYEASKTPYWLALAVLLLVLFWVLRLSATNWQSCRRLVWIAAPLFVISEPVLAKLLAPPLSWPPVRTQAVASAQPFGKPAITLVLLLDELSSHHGARFADTLRQAGLQVSTTNLRPVDDSTSNVLPAMFLGRQFDHGRPCSATAICSGHDVLDFARIEASRPDIDVVGFLHPYCSIAGLRSCYRAEAPLVFYRWDRTACAAWRRTGIALGVKPESCEGIYNHPWEEMAGATIRAVDRAPVWNQGGMLFAHLPLPHPVTYGQGQHFEGHYEANLQRAISIVADYVRRAQALTPDVSVVIFSDHPLRPALWCAQWDFSGTTCERPARFDDEHVPLIVGTSSGPVDLSGLQMNSDIFKVMPRLPR